VTTKAGEGVAGRLTALNGTTLLIDRGAAGPWTCDALVDAESIALAD
jgi:hypothetical protein